VRERAVFSALSLLGILVASIAHVVPSAAAAVEGEVPTVAGSTVVYGEGHTGIVLQVPQETSLPKENYVVELLDGANYAYAGFADPAPDACARTQHSLIGMCVIQRAYQLKMPQASQAQLGLDPPMVHRASITCVVHHERRPGPGDDDLPGAWGEH
jgi:hypothetical protein